MKKKILIPLIAVSILISVFSHGDSSDTVQEASTKIETTSVSTTKENDKAEAASLTKLNIAIDDSTEHDINIALPVSLTAKPFDADISELSCESSGGTFSNDNGQLTFIASEPGTYTLFVSCKDVKSNTLTIVVEDIVAKRQAEEAAAAQAAAEKAEQEHAAAEAAQIAAQSVQPQEQMVWISATGSKYHNKPNCGRMNPDKATQMPLSEAQKHYEPCSKCF